MNILVTGSTGFIGSALVSSFTNSGHTVTRLVRGQVTQGAQELVWDPVSGAIDREGLALAEVEAVVHLAGESIAGRWTAQRKARILDSRVQGTRFLSETLVGLDQPPEVLACASAKDYYGDRGNETVREDSAPGTDFLADVISKWEAAAATAAQGGIRVVNLRFGMVLDPAGGALARMLTPFRLCLGGRLGSGRQHVSWVSLIDALGAISHVLATDSIEGSVNVAAPGDVTNAEFARLLGRVLSRPTLFPMPPFALRAMFGEVAGTLLASVRMDPGKLLASGFTFQHPQLEDALRSALRKR